MAMSIKYEDQDPVGLLDTERNRRFVATFRDLGRDLNGERFTVDIGPVDWYMRDSELTFQVTPATRIAVKGRTFGEDPKPDLGEYFADGGRGDQDTPII